MNALDELLSGEASPSIDDLRSATTITLSALKHDRRLELLDFPQARSLAQDLFHTPDIRTLVRTQAPFPRESYEDGLRDVASFDCRIQLEVVDHTSLEDPRIQIMQRAMTARGGQMRIAPVPYRANIYNAAFVMLARDFDDNSVGAYAISEPDLVGALVRLHARLFRNGSRWNGKDTADSVANVDLVDVLGQLLVGSTDETAAQHLHISLRTYRRRVRELLRQMGAASRFQAGVIAQERHYIALVRDEEPFTGAGAAPYLEALSRTRPGSSR
jgi:hypothetical protein